MTTPVNSAFGGIAFGPAPTTTTVQALSASWKSLIGGGGGGGADGYSLNIGADLQDNFTAEEGTGSGLTVTVDTFDNGAGLDPGGTGIQIKWGGAIVAFNGIPKDNPGDGRFLRKNSFVDAALRVSPSGNVSFTYDGNSISYQVPGYTGIAVNQVNIAARTGGANDNHWIDDLKIVSASAPQLLVAPQGSEWAYNDTTLAAANLHGTGWELAGYNTNSAPGWKLGTALFGNDSAGIYDAAHQPFSGGVNGFQTPLNRGSSDRATFYFRTKFNWSGSAVGVTLVSSNWVDDGMVAYLNGVEVSRIRLPDGAIEWGTLGSNPGTEGLVEVRNWNSASLVEGENTLAVELHQSGLGSSDIAFALSLTGIPPTPPAIVDESGLVGGVVFANRTKTLSVVAIGAPAVSYQWYRDGVAIDPIENPTATAASYVITTMQPSDEGGYFCRISNVIGSTDSRTVTLTYVNDVTPPVVASASSDSFMNSVVVVFDELVDLGSSTDLFSYSLNPAINITGASRRADGRSVLLTLESPLTPDTDYTVTATGVADLAGNPMISGSATFHTYVFAQGWVLKEYFRDYTAGVDALIGDAARLAAPNLATMTNLWEMNAADQFDNYGGRISGFFVANEDGPHTFYISSDDPGRLFISTDENPANKVLVASEPTWAGRRQWTGTPGDGSGAGRETPSPSGGPNANVTGPINMVKGQRYYVESYFTEGGGGDNMAVTVQPPSMTTVPPNGSLPLASFNIGSFVPRGEGSVAIGTQPTPTTVLENANATFTVAGTGSFRGVTDVSFSWERSDDAGATWKAVTTTTSKTGSTLTVPVVTIANDNGDLYRVRLFVPGASATSDSVALTVTSDATPPTIVNASGNADMRSITIGFSELMNGGSLEDLFNYAVSGGLSVTAAARGPDGKSVTLTVDPAMTEDTTYTVTVDNVSDLAGNAIASGTTVSFRSFVFSAGFLSLRTYEGIGTVAVSAMTSHPSYPNSPTRSFFLGGFDTRLALPTDSLENFGGRIDGFFVPPVSGNWILYLRSDDASELYMDLNDSAGLVKIQEETGCCGAFSGHPTAPLALVAGQRYQILGLYKEAGGGDYMQVAAKLETDPTPPDALRPISAPLLGTFVSGAGVSITANTQPADQTFLVIPPSAGGGPLIDETFTVGNGGFTAVTPNAAFSGTPFSYDSGAGSWQVNQADPEANVPHTTYITSPTQTIQRSGYALLTFSHRWSVEQGFWDGCVVQVSVNGGAFTTVPAGAFTVGGYNGTVLGNSRSVVAGQQAFVLDSAGHQAGTFVGSSANLGFFSAGDTVAIRFLYAGDTNTKGNFVPSWEITSVKLVDGSAPNTVTFNFSASAVVPGNANPPVFYQWYRDGNIIAGANGASYTFAPILADNGAKFRCTAYTLGGNVVSREALLTVAQPNTPPSFVCGPNQGVNEDSGAQTVAGWASNIRNHSIARVPVAYANDFSSGAAGMQLAGVATVADGVLKLTTEVTGQYGAAGVSAALNRYESLDVKWKSLVGGGLNGGADGYSLNIGTDVPADPGYGGEEGIGTGLTVTVDTFDNGTGQDVGVDIKWGGARVAYALFVKDDDGSGTPVLRKNAFVDAHLTLDGAGVATMTYDGTTISATIPGYAGLQATRALFWGRTGGASDNQWVDDFSFAGFPYDASVVEAGQTVQFLVNNDNPSLFSVQPAIAANGTLTYTAAANAHGVANVSVVAQDNGGTAFGGRDTSAACSFTITVNSVCDAPVAANDDGGSTIGSAPLTINVLANDTDIEGGLTITAVTQGANGSVAISGNSVVYTANAGFAGVDTFVYSVANACQGASRATVTVRVLPDSAPPTAKIATDALVDFSPDFEHPVLISCNWWNACLILDGSLSSDPDGDALSYLWFVEPSPVPFAAGPVATNCLEVGTHTIILTVTDADGMSDSDSLTIEEITAPLAIELLMEKVNESRVSRAIKRELLAVLRTALNQSKNERIRPTQTTLDAFEKKVRAKVTAGYPAEAAAWIRWSQAISSGMEKCIKAPVVKKDYSDDKGTTPRK